MRKKKLIEFVDIECYWKDVGIGSSYKGLFIR